MNNISFACTDADEPALEARISVSFPAGASEYQVLDFLTRVYAEASHRITQKMETP